MTDVREFVGAWAERGSEKSDAQLFWIALLRLFDIDRPERFIQFEVPIDVEGQACFIDALIPSTRVLIEQKSRGIDLDKPAKQSDGKFLTPFNQAKRYADARAYSQRPRWIVVCNFVEIRIYDMDRYHQRRDEHYQPNVISLERLPYEFSRLNFLVDPNDENVDPSIKISKRAGEIIGDLYRAFGAFDPVALNKLCVRLVFCLYAEDSFIFDRNQFTDYIRRAVDRRAALVELFDVLNTPEDQRDPNLRAELEQFPYVNGDLFVEPSDIPIIDNVISHYLLIDAGDDARFNWSGISPTIFGALFESTLNPLTRRTGGMHYTSIENIHKLIDPLFLDELHDEFNAIKRRRKLNRRRALEKFQLKLARLKFFDPACGSGNFLTETYLSLRRLENKVIRELHGLGARCRIEVSIENFYGIEINDFAVAVARTALWIAENQMLQETEMIIHEDIAFLPLTSAAHIFEGNALTLDWKKIAPRGVDYIMGNPPFVGKSYRTKAQQSDMARVFDGIKGGGNLDFVASWFKKAADFMSRRSEPIRAAFVATNSITQGIAVPPLWNYLFDSGIHIDFAHRTFRWLSESEDMASVHCVIVGFSHAPNDKPRIIFDGDKKIIATNINAYLLDAPNLIVEDRAEPLCDVPKMTVGSCPTDGGGFIIEVADYEDFIRREPRSKKFIHPYVGGDEFINGKSRWCLWLKDATADDLCLPLIAERVEVVRRFRLSSKKEQTRRRAATPTLFAEDRYVGRRSIFVPMVSSYRRRYVPMGFIDGDVVANNKSFLIADADLFHFGVLESIVHMAWMRTICGRLKSDYSYSTTMVYNNFVWCARSASIEESARKILEARALYPTWTLAALYNEETMPVELRAAHQRNDEAVLDAYGFERSMSEAEIVARLMTMYQRKKKSVDAGRSG